MSVARLAESMALGLSWSSDQLPLSNTRVGSTEFDWDKVTPHKHFEWQSCFGDFKCARLQVPMDWQNTTSESNRTVEIAVVKVEATVPVTDPTYGGAVVLNPGGPGGSGVDQLLNGGHHVRTILSAGPDAEQDGAKNFDIIGFDPRAINNTRPMLSCFPDHLTAAAFNIAEETYGWFNTSNIAFDNLWASKRAVAEGCSRTADNDGIAKHVSTAAVARDVIEIFERHGEWRAREAERFMTKSPSILSPADIDKTRERTMYEPGKEMVQYWGFSYGTVLGGTIAAMFPDRVKRMVLDGVVDGEDYMAARWSSNVYDVDRMLPLMAEYCFEGGPRNCALFDEAGSKVILEKIHAAMSSLKGISLAVAAEGDQGPVIVTYNDLQKRFRFAVYNPLNAFTELAQILDEISNGKATILASYKRVAHPELRIPLTKSCKAEGPWSFECVKPVISLGLDLGGPVGIACSDGTPRTDETKEEFRDYVNKVSAQSQLVGESWAAIMAPCTAWHARPTYRYGGNFTYAPAHPVLFVGNTVDPATPLANAFKMAERSNGASILHQKSEGHCSHASPSMCTGKAIRRYFQEGDTSNQGEDVHVQFCRPDRKPFDGYTEEDEPELPQNETDEALWRALVGINRGWHDW